MTKLASLFFLSVMLALPPPLALEAAPRKKDFKLLKMTDLPAAGIRVPIMGDSRETPLPSPSAQTYEIRSGDQRFRRDMYNARDLWIRRQILSRWEDDSGNTLIIANLRFPLPSEKRDEPVIREEFESALSNIEQKSWSDLELVQWVADFAEAQPVRLEIARKPNNLSALALFRFPQKTNTLVCVFRLNRAGAGQSQATQEIFAALFELAPEINFADALETVSTRFVPAITVAQKKASDVANSSSSFQAPIGAKRERNQSPEFIASKEAIIAGIKNSKEWWFAETPNYILLSNLSLKHRHTAIQLQEEIEIMRGIFAKMIPPHSQISAISVIRLFADPRDFEAYVGEDFKWSSGLWMPEKKELVIRPCEWGSTKQQRTAMLRVVFHEAFHQYLFYALDMVQSPPWFNEGHACFFESADVSRQRVTIEEDERFSSSVSRIVADNALDFKSIFAADYNEFYSGSDDDREKRYSQAWAIIYFLRKAAAAEKIHPYDGFLDSYLNTLLKTKDFKKANSEAIPEEFIEGLQSNFLAFWKSKNRRSAASRFPITSSAASSNPLRR